MKPPPPPPSSRPASPTRAGSSSSRIVPPRPAYIKPPPSPAHDRNRAQNHPHAVRWARWGVLGLLVVFGIGVVDRLVNGGADNQVVIPGILDLPDATETPDSEQHDTVTQLEQPSATDVFSAQTLPTSASTSGSFDTNTTAGISSGNDGTSASDAVYFANCSDARAAGAAPLYAGDPGYRLKLDRDRDGVACE